MKRLCFLLFALSAVSCGRSVLESKLSELDDVLRHRGEYAALYENRILDLKKGYATAADDAARWSSAYGIYGLYKNCQVDSSAVYLDLLGKLSGDDFDRRVRTALANVEVLVANRNYSKAEELLSSLDTLKMNDTLKGDFYNSALLLYASRAIDETLPDEQREYNVRLRYQTRQKYISCPGIDSFETIRRPAIQMYEDGNIKTAIPILEALVSSAPEEKKAHAAYSLAKAYEASGNTEKVKFWFAQGAIYNLKVPSGEHLSLYELSIILFGEHKLARALSYSQAALEESLACNYNARIINSANTQLSIVRAAEYRESRIKTVWQIVIVLLALLSATIFFFWQKTLSQSRKIGRMNRMLEEAGKIKEGYVFRYINLSARYLRMVEEYRHDLRITLKEGGEAALREKLRQPESEIQALNHKQFYSIFDETFMGIYPDFVTKVNALLQEDARFTVRYGGEFPTPLRILAAMRLGITDSGKIAEFLNCAPRSVYTHRSKIKKSALCPPEEFEKRISEI